MRSALLLERACFGWAIVDNDWSQSLLSELAGAFGFALRRVRGGAPAGRPGYEKQWYMSARRHGRILSLLPILGRSVRLAAGPLVG